MTHAIARIAILLVVLSAQGSRAASKWHPYARIPAEVVSEATSIHL